MADTMCLWWRTDLPAQALACRWNCKVVEWSMRYPYYSLYYYP